MNAWLWGACLLAAAGCLGGPPVLARETPANPSRKAKAPKAPRPAPQASPGENRSERDKRLQRECRGKPNAGACEGYAS
jgi:hypothetical protein